jgi:hypothetical protein
MPWIIPFIPLIAAGATVGTSVGLYEAGKGQTQQEEQAQQAQLNQEQMQQAQQNALAKQKAIQATLANAQGQSGGTLNSPGLVNLASVIAGFPGAGGDSSGSKALADYLGTGGEEGQSGTGTGSGNLVSQTYGLSGTQG